MAGRAGGLLTLRRRVWAKCKVELLEPLHLGAGRDPTSPIDLQIMKDSRGMPIIPGSSLKGFFRSYLSRMLLGVRISGRTSVRVGNLDLDLEPCVDSISERKNDQSSIDELCLLDKLFGYAGKNISLTSRIKFTDASLTNPLPDPTLVRTHVSLDRERDAAERGMLTNVEAVRERVSQTKTTEFTFTIIFDEVSDPRFTEANKVFYILLLLLDNGIEDFLGGWKSRGYGHVRLKLDGLKVAEIDDLLSGSARETDLPTLLASVPGVSS